MKRNIVWAALGIFLAASLWPPLAPAQEASPSKEAKTDAPPAAKFVFKRPKGPVPTPSVQGPKLAVTLREAVSLALARNFDITIEAFNPNLRESDLTRSKAAFDPSLVASGQTTKSKIETASSFSTGSTKSVTSTQELQAGVKQKLITGADYSLMFDWVRDRNNSLRSDINPNFTTQLTFTLTQPLLKNFGIDVNKADIYIAATQRDQALQAYRGRVIEVVNNVEQAYWNLVFTISNLKFRRESLNLAKDLLRRNRIQVEVGTLAPIEVLTAQATVASRQNDVIVAERQVHDSEDALKNLLNVADTPSSWALHLAPSDKPTYQPVKLNEMNLILDALRKRSDLESARLQIQRFNYDVKRTHQQLLPELNLVGSAANNSLQDRTSKALGREFSNKGYELSGGVTFSYPIGNRDAKAAYRSARLSKAQAQASRDQIEQNVMVQVRQAVRQVRANTQLIESTRIARRLAEEQLAAQEKKFSVGLSTSRDVLEDQSSLANALTNEISALVDYNKSLATLSSVTQSTLQRFGIKLADPREIPSEKKP